MPNRILGLLVSIRTLILYRVLYPCLVPVAG